MLAIWPVVSLLLFMRMPAPKALLWSVIGGYLLLPSATRFDLPGLPDLDRNSMIAIGAGLGALLFGQRPRRLGGSLLFYGLGTVFVLSPFMTAYLNPDPIVGRNLFFPGLTSYDGLSLAGANLFALVPFWSARRLLADERGHRLLLNTLVVATLGYSLLVLLEIRLSPQLHRWVYGFFPHDFGQQMRAGGFRAVVFLSHGLLVALLLSTAMTASVALAKAKRRIFGVGAGMTAVYLLGVLLLQKSLGPVILGAIFATAIWLASARWQLLLASLVGMIVCVYPVVRGSQILPIESVQAMATSFSPDRGSSLQTRLVNEQRLLEKASERPVFGWGNWGRNRVYDLESGRDISITDGLWVIQIGTFGWVGYVALFGLLALPALRLLGTFRGGVAIPPETAAVAVLVCVNLVDLVPNASLSPLTWLMAGSLLVSRPRRQPPAEHLAEADQQGAIVGQGVMQ